MPTPSRGDVWEVDLNPVQGHEQGGQRPAAVISADRFNHGRAELVIILPITTRFKNVPLHVEVNPPEGGVTQRSFIKVEDIRSVTVSRLLYRRGELTPDTLEQIEERLKALLYFRRR